MPQDRPGETRAKILASLSVVDKEGATREELIAFDNGIADNSTNRAYGTSLGHLVEDRIVTKKNGKFYLTESITPRPGTPTLALQNSAHTLPEKHPLPAFSKDRAGHTVLLYTSPSDYEHVARVEYNFGGDNWFRSPLVGDLRICLGPDVPKWSPAQEVNRGIYKIRLIALDGIAEEITTNPSYPITIAPGEIIQK